MKHNPDIYLDRVLHWWGNTSLRFPWIVLFFFIGLSGLSLTLAIEKLGFNTNTSEMLSPDLPFQKARKRFEDSFPEDVGTLLLVIDGQTPEQARNSVREFGRRLSKEKAYVKSVYIPGESEFFDREGLLYLDVDDLEDLATELSRAQPFIGRLAKDYSLHGLLSILSYAMDNSDDSLPLEIDPLLSKINDAVMAVADNDYYQLSWQQLMYGEQRVSTRRFILVKPIVDFSEFLPAEQAISKIREIANGLKTVYPQLRIRISGELALEHEELESVSKGAIWAGLLTLVLVCLSLLVGLRSVKLMFATLVSLILGLLLTAGFAAITVGHLNVISIAFAVLYIGLGVDYAIHLCLRYRNFVEENVPNNEALTDSIRSVGPSIILCAVTTSIGLYAFIPTDYTGVSELGIIAGTGMFIGLLVTLSVLPAILKILPVKKVNRYAGIFPHWIYAIPFRYSATIRGLAILLAVLTCALLFKVQFDSNPVNMRDQKAESVTTFKQLLTSSDDSPFALTILNADPESVLETAKKFERLTTVKSSVTVFDFVPDDQDEKMTIVEDLGLLLGPLLESFGQTPDSDNNHQALQDFLAKVNRRVAMDAESSSEVLLRLQAQLLRFVEKLEAHPHQEREILKQLETSLLGSLPTSMMSIQMGLQTQGVDLQSLPADVYRRWVSPEGVYRIQIVPKEDLNDPQNLKDFVEDVQSLEKSVVGLPVADQASGKAIVLAFKQAFVGALMVITILLLIILRSLRDTLLVVLPLLLAGALTGASTVILDSPFNFANIIALPLLLGLGVDSGIHIVHRLRISPDGGRELLRTSTARGIFFSSLTTFFSFSSLVFTDHLGVASMGLLLTVGISFTLLCTLIVIPAFTETRPSKALAT